MRELVRLLEAAYRDVREIARHVAAGKLAYHAAAFGDGTHSWEAASAAPDARRRADLKRS